MIEADSPFPTLHTPRLHLREMIESDAETLLAIHGDTETMQWFGTDPLTELAQAQKLVQTFAGWRKLPNPGTRWGIEDVVRGQLLGSCGLFKWDKGWRCCSLGYELARNAQGKGYMREALIAILDWGFHNMALNRIQAQVHPENIASIKLLGILGFAEEGRLREAGYWNGRYHDLLQFGLLARDFTG
ncbi:GNAT family N-acetyltransferase [Parachitinimonas caeni]|uniref:GNAT family protein n=1 Tax=Parachitinimonas caeni TaxID=3031301 RepID=A0ABT7DYQ1_9NEIS|nr:GNAT family protein [Parachitinimonas caeni]MDK2125197.1 GNAT family protein [Parachitinimonas caeni]